MSADGVTLAVVRDEWSRRVVAEYGSAALAHSITFWLMKLGASPTLLHEGLRIAGDELVHAELSFAVVAEAGGGEVELSAAGLGLEPDDQLSLVENVAVQGVRIFCLGETVAVRLFRRLREDCTVAVARAALDRVLTDEVRHRDFGWLLLEWLAARPDWPTCQAVIGRRLPGQFAELRKNYGPSGGAQSDFDNALRAWGMMPAAEYHEALLETLERDYLPRFRAFGVDARRAFDTMPENEQ